MLDRRRMLIASQQGKRLPAEYQEVEYIEVSANGVGIDINVSIPSTSKITCVFQNGVNQVQTTGYYWFFTAGEYGRTFIAFGIRSLTFHCFYTSTSTANPQIAAGIQKNEIVFDGNITLNGTIYNTNSGTYRIATPLSVLVAPSNMNAVGSRLFAFQVINDGDILVDLIPCYRKSDNEVGVYDLVSKSFYGNAVGNTGYYIAGGNI